PQRGWGSSEALEAPLRVSSKIEAAIGNWRHERNFGLIVVPDPTTNAHRKLINEAAGRHELPVIDALQGAVANEGLMSHQEFGSRLFSVFPCVRGSLMRPGFA